MGITRTAMIDDDGTGTTGTILNNAWKTELYNQIDALAGNPWILIPHSAGMYTATAGVWTVSAANQITFRYLVIGKIAFFILMLDVTTTTVATARLFVTLPAGVPLSMATMQTPATYYHTGGAGTGHAEITGTATIGFLRDILGTAWAPTSAGLYLRASWFWPIA